MKEALAAIGVAAAALIGASASAAPPKAPAASLARALAPGDILGAADLRLADADDDAADLALTLVGKEARRMLPEGAPIRAADFRAPILVERNKPVRMEFQKGPLTMTMEGRALSGGAKDDIVKVMNVQSKTVVSAIVVGRGKVVVQ